MIFFMLYPNIFSLAIFIFSIIAIEIYINTHYVEIKNDEIFIHRGIVNKKTIRLEKNLVHEVILEKNIYLYLLRLSTIRLKTFDKEYKIPGIKEGEKIFKNINKFLKLQKV